MRFFIQCFICIMLSQPCYAKIIDRVIAVVNGEIITLFELQAEAAPEIIKHNLNYNNSDDIKKIKEIERAVLDGMINHILLIQDAERLKIAVTKDEVENEYNQIILRNHMTSEEFQKQLDLQNVTEENFKERIRTNILRSRLLGTMVGRKIVVTKQEIEEFYNKNYNKLKNDNQFELAMLIYPPSADAESWASQINSGKVSFEEVVKKLSVGPKAEEGGNLGVINVEDINPEWIEVLSNMKSGEVSSLIDINGLKGQLKLINIITGEPQTLDSVTPYIEELLREPKVEERFKEYSDQLQKRAVIDIRY